jgi:hypothetical protein
MNKANITRQTNITKRKQRTKNKTESRMKSKLRKGKGRAAGQKKTRKSLQFKTSAWQRHEHNLEWKPFITIKLNLKEKHPRPTVA